MQTITIAGPRDGPENEEETEFVRFDPSSPHSVRDAQHAIRERLGLSYLPMLCSPPQPGVARRTARAMWQWMLNA